MPGERLLTSLTACPRCDKAPLTDKGSNLRCSGCKTEFASLAGIPWLFAAPDATLADWQNRLHFALQTYATEAQRIRAALKDETLPDPTVARLEAHADAIDVHRNALRDLLAPLDIHASSGSFESYLAMRTRLPTDQGIATYYANIHRDWCWGDEENLQSRDIVLASAGDWALGRTLVLGAGAGRLAYDLHMAGTSELTVALDFNPLLMMVAKRLVAGERLDLHEFPIAPVNTADVAVLRELAAPEAARDGFELVLADVLRAPFRDGAFDTVVTPWIIDIVSEPLPVLAARINRLLAEDGRWLNLGSVAFDHPQPARRLGAAEVLHVVGGAGFEVTSSGDRTIPYMCSPASRHGRSETVLSFCAVKSADVPRPERHRALPDWIVTGKEAVPALTSFRTQAATTRIHAFIMSLVDGKRTLDDMATLLEQQRLMPRNEAIPALRNFFTRMYEDAERATTR